MGIAFMAAVWLRRLICFFLGHDHRTIIFSYNDTFTFCSRCQHHVAVKRLQDEEIRRQRVEPTSRVIDPGGWTYAITIEDFEVGLITVTEYRGIVGKPSQGIRVTYQQMMDDEIYNWVIEMCEHWWSHPSSRQPRDITLTIVRAKS